MPYPAEDIAAGKERTHQLARMYKMHLDDAFAWERWDDVAKWAEHLARTLRSVHDPDGPLMIPTPVPRRPVPRRPAGARQIELD